MSAPPERIFYAPSGILINSLADAAYFCSDCKAALAFLRRKQIDASHESAVWRDLQGRFQAIMLARQL